MVVGWGLCGTGTMDYDLPYDIFPYLSNYGMVFTPLGFLATLFRGLIMYESISSTTEIKQSQAKKMFEAVVEASLMWASFSIGFESLTSLLVFLVNAILLAKTVLKAICLCNLGLDEQPVNFGVSVGDALTSLFKVI